MTTPIFYIKAGSLSFGEKLIFDELEFYLYPRDKICFVGKNGSGKSSLLKIITGEYELDSGEMYKSPVATISYLKQDAEIITEQNIKDYILDGLSAEDYKYQADMIIENLDLDHDTPITNLSGGQKRRVELAKILCRSPDILLLDEPTNHLDIKTIEWLESYLKSYQGCVVVISHDRKFLSNVTNKIWWLDRSFLRKSNEGFKNFEEWQEKIIEFEENQLRKLDKKLSQENLWLTQGVTARRKRNQKRLASLKSLRTQMQNFKAHVGRAKTRLSHELEKGEAKSKFIIEADNITFFAGTKQIIKNFSLKIIKGEKIGIVGRNGSGKSTLIKLLTKNLEPSSGKIKHGTNLEITYIDQQRLDLKPNETLASFLCPAGDTIFMRNREIHVAGYLKQFLFDPKMMHAKVSTLSGGEKNRLLLAKSLIKPGNVMILDEPTNDLDVDTLDLLLEILSDYDGTLIVVSHDRDFLDKLVIKTIVFTEDNEILEIVGGFEDYERYLKATQSEVSPQSTKAKNIKAIASEQAPATKKNQDKITFKDLHLKQTLPKEIEKLETEIKQIETSLADPALYKNDNKKFSTLASSLKTKQDLLDSKLNQWIELEERTSG
ncbi:MAG: ABC-F family ATP-binding cassette domain-containing protein [Rickettsiaceae bacterium]|nr:ABC-F family ATP-binding cassette domain-containing protein [Rickettsiaceae bacterium]